MKTLLDNNIEKLFKNDLDRLYKYLNQTYLEAKYIHLSLQKHGKLLITYCNNSNHLNIVEINIMELIEGVEGVESKVVIVEEPKIKKTRKTKLKAN